MAEHNGICLAGRAEMQHNHTLDSNIVPMAQTYSSIILKLRQQHVIFTQIRVTLFCLMQLSCSRLN